MNNVLKNILFAFLALLMTACHGTVDPEFGKEPEPEDVVRPSGPEDVPDGVLRIFADRTEIAADGSDKVTFTVMFGKEDVSNAKTLQLVRTFGGEEKYMAYGANGFSTTTPGAYKFKAKYYYSGNHFSDNELEVVANQVYSGEEKNYRRRFLGTYFTSIGCTSCPLSSKALQELQAARPGEISVAAFHADFPAGSSNPMTIPETAEFNAGLGGFSGLPAFFWNMRESSYFGGSSNYVQFEESLAREMGEYSTFSGVSVNTVLDSGTSELNIEVGVTSNLPSVFRYQVILVEDGIPAEGEYEQQSNSKLDNYVHNNVVRKVLTGVFGDKMNDNLPLTVGVEAKASKSVTLEEGWKAENMRVIVSALTSDDGGFTWTVNNVNECKVGKNAPYLYEGDEENGEDNGDDNGDVPANMAYEKHVCLVEFTGGWCINCPNGYSGMMTMLSTPSLKKYADRIHICAFHSDMEGRDDLAIPQTQDVFKLFKGLEYPSFAIDLRDSGSLTSEGLSSQFKPSLEAAFEEHAVHCGVAVSSSRNEDKAEVTVKVASGLTSEYRVVLLVVEDKVKGWQKSNVYPDGQDDYIHRHVVRKVVTAYANTFTGEKLTDDGQIKAGEEKSKSWTVELDEAWNLADTKVYALVLDGNGHVNNTNLCAISGGNSDYKIKK